ncbi:MAG TPA: hypothetical protein VG870_09430 [Chitinophagaceae bacterium]|nr:hypothetical protein [Chitinophagaceae bacterium]
MATHPFSLDRLVSRLIAAELPQAVRRGSLVVNDVPPGTWLGADETLVETVLAKLLCQTILSSHQGCIRVSAWQEEGFTQIALRDNNSDYSRYISGKMNKVEPLLRRLDAGIEFEFNRRGSIRIVLHFSHRRRVA